MGMKTFNSLVLNFTVVILDFLYKGRDIQRFWVLEEIARAPYFAFMSVLHFRESMGLRGPEHTYLRGGNARFPPLSDLESAFGRVCLGGRGHWAMLL